MNIYTDVLTERDLRNALTRAIPDGVVLEIIENVARKRARRFRVILSAEGGSDKHGIKRRPSNSGTYGGLGYSSAATYIEWGDWMVKLFKIDPKAIIGPYDDARQFCEATQSQSTGRPAREDAITHALRWTAELGMTFDA